MHENSFCAAVICAQGDAIKNQDGADRGENIGCLFLPFLRSCSSYDQYHGVLVVVIRRVKRASVFVSCRVSGDRKEKKNGACVGKGMRKV